QHSKKPVVLATHSLVDSPKLQGYIADLVGVEAVVTA
ncbi:phosphoenolpyruvate synthase, partial [Vibrio makurazakiensis]